MKCQRTHAGTDRGRMSARGRHLLALLCATLLLCVSAPAGAGGQTTAAARFVIGEVTEIDPPSLRVVVRTDAGELLTVPLDEKTVYLKVPAADKVPSVEQGVPVKLDSVGVGDRVLAHVPARAAVARRLLVMSKADILEKQEQERALWRRRGMSGTVAALNPATREISVSMRAAGLGAAPRTVVVEASGAGVVFLRYAPGSVKFADARPGEFDQLRVGDQLRALGEKSPDGSRFTAEKVMSGAFRVIGGTVTEVNPVTREVKIADLQKRQPLTLSVSADTQLKRLPADVAARLGPAPAAPPPPTQASAAGVTGGADADLQTIIERLPLIDLNGLKPGDVVVASTASGAESERVVAAVLVAGVGPLLGVGAPAQGAAGRPPLKRPLMTSINFGIGLP